MPPVVSPDTPPDVPAAAIPNLPGFVPPPVVPVDEPLVCDPKQPATPSASEAAAIIIFIFAVRSMIVLLRSLLELHEIVGGEDALQHAFELVTARLEQRPLVGNR